MNTQPRYEIRATMRSDSRERVIGWAETREAGEVQANNAVAGGVWRNPWVLDRDRQAVVRSDPAPQAETAE